MEKYCKCGCGEKLDFTKGRKNKKYKQGHYARVENKGAKARKGQKPWNKGIARTDKEKKNISHAIKAGKAKSDYVMTEEHKRKISESNKKIKKDKEWIDKIIKNRTNGKKYKEWKENISNTLKEKYENGDIDITKHNFFIDGRYKEDPNSHFNQYGGKFTYYLKTKIRKRDKFICNLCGNENSKIVHHIDHNKLNNDERNLITLCGSCHAKHHHPYNKKQQITETKYFKKIIKDIYENTRSTDLR